MALDFLIKLVAQDDHVLAFTGQGLLIGVPRIPDPRFTHEVEPSLMNYDSFLTLGIRAEKDGGAKNPLEGTDEAAILRSSLLHPKGVEHLSGASKGDDLFLLPDGQGGKENRNQPILAPGQTVGWMARHLKVKLTIAPLVEQNALRWPLDRKAAQYERSRSKTEILANAIALQPY